LCRYLFLNTTSLETGEEVIFARFFVAAVSFFLLNKLAIYL